MRTVSLSPLTVLPCSPLEHLRAAADAGFQTVSLRIFPVMDTDVDVLSDASLMGGIEQHLKELDLAVFDVEVVRVTAETDVGALSRALDFAGRIGAQRFAVTSGTPEDHANEDQQHLVDTFGRLTQAAATRGVGVMLEFIPFREINSLPNALDVVRAVNHPGLGVTLDALHFFRSGGTVDQLAGVDATLLACAQLCDGPAKAPSDLPREARYGRLYPGDGEFPLHDFLAALPDTLPVSVEVPGRQAEMSVTDRAHAAAVATRRLLDLTATR